jgi:hypothetical protein
VTAFQFTPLGTGIPSLPGVALAPSDSHFRLPDSAMQSCSRSVEARKRWRNLGPHVRRDRHGEID